MLRGSKAPRLTRGRALFPEPQRGSRALHPSPTLRRYLSTISRPQLLHTHLPGGQTEPEAMDWGEDDGESGAEEEQESSSPAPSGFTCRNSRALAADPSSLPRLTYPRGTPQALSTPPSASWGTQTCKPLESRSPAFCPAQGAGGSPVGRRPTHQSFFPGAFAGPPGRQGCRPPTLLRHEPRALRRESGEDGETRVRSRRRARGAPQPRPRRALEGPPHEGGACSHGHLSPGAAGGPARSLPGPPPPAGDSRTAGPRLRARAPRSPRHAGSPPPAGGTQLITGLRAQSDCFLDVNHPGVGETPG